MDNLEKERGRPMSKVKHTKGGINCGKRGEIPFPPTPVSLNPGQCSRIEARKCKLLGGKRNWGGNETKIRKRGKAGRWTIEKSGVKRVDEEEGEKEKMERMSQALLSVLLLPFVITLRWIEDDQGISNSIDWRSRQFCKRQVPRNVTVKKSASFNLYAFMPSLHSIKESDGEKYVL